jgi:hypothetical protein
MPPGTPDFYSAAAQIIPVLILVLIVEQRDEKRRLPALANLAYVLLTVGSAALGEMVALRALYRGHAHLQDQYFVVFALAVCGVALAAPVVWSTWREVDAEHRGLTWRLATFLTIAVVYVIGVVFFVLVQQKG